jgi:regulator of sigma E protease
MDILVMAAQLILGLSILVGVHELGHMVAAKYFGMRVEKFSIGFPPKIFGKQIGETEYSIGAIPLGGFVKISGMVDESLDTEMLAQEPQAWEFRAKPAWQRLIVMLGGIIVNVVTGVFIYILITFIYGEKYVAMDEVNKNGIYAHQEAKNIGLQNGDKIISINGQPIQDLSQIKKVMLENNTYFEVMRGEQLIKINIPSNLLDKLSDKETGFIDPLLTFRVGELKDGMNAQKAGIQKGDSIIALNNTNIHFFQELQDVLKLNKSKTVALSIKRNDSVMVKQVAIDSNGLVGFMPDIHVESSIREYSLLAAIPRGTFKSFDVIFDQLKAFGKIFRGELSPQNSLGSFFSIGKAYGGVWNWERFWSLTAMLSMVLAFMNILPIPALDGGHVVFLMYEIIARRKPSDKFMENAQKVGMVILLSLMVFAIGNDIFKNFFK